MNLPPPTVFLVDDEALVRKAVGRLLRAEGFEVAAFASPGEFLAAHDPAAPGCLVLDMAMPGLDGLELQRASPRAAARCRSSSSQAARTSQCARRR